MECVDFFREEIRAQIGKEENSAHLLGVSCVVVSEPDVIGSHDYFDQPVSE